jgi:hypothetical protein
MVLGVQPDRLGVVVDRDVGRAAERPLDAERGAATAGEVIDDQLVGVNAESRIALQVAASL